MDDLLFEKECYKIIGICQTIHAKLGKGFKEVVYQDAFQIHAEIDELIFEREKKFSITYLGQKLRHGFIADYFLFNGIILEIKATPVLNYKAFAQTLNYLKASEVKLGIIVNFGEDHLTFRRVVCTR